jgi:nucleoside-diphosphate-sugar epimerase
LPPGIALRVGTAAEWWGRLTGSAPFTARWVRTLLEDRRVNIAPAKRDLGYRPRGLVEGLEETIAWLRAERLIRA